jgi:hypothetical protein
VQYLLLDDKFLTGKNKGQLMHGKITFEERTPLGESQGPEKPDLPTVSLSPDTPHSRLKLRMSSAKKNIGLSNH